MPCLVLKKGKSERRIPPDPDGQFRYVPQPGEIFDGSIDPNCGGEIALQPQNDTTAELLSELDQKLGKGGGDWLKVFFAPVAKILGKANCMSCEVRRVVTNAYSNLREKRGRLRALAAMFRLWRLSMKDPAKAAEKLKEYLA
jgi:hypothetical protein